MDALILLFAVPFLLFFVFCGVYQVILVIKVLRRLCPILDEVIIRLKKRSSNR